MITNAPLGSTVFAGEHSPPGKAGSKGRGYNRATRRHASAVDKKPEDVVGKATNRQDTPGAIDPFSNMPRAHDPGDGPSPRGPPIFIALPAVMARTGLAKSTIYMLVGRGDFPAPVQATPRRVFWIESEVAGWQADRIRQREANTAAS